MVKITCTVGWMGLSQVSIVVNNLPAKEGDIRDAVLIPGLGRSSGGGNGNPLRYSCLESPTDRGAWWATLLGVEKESDMTERDDGPPADNCMSVPGLPSRPVV